MDRFPKQPSEVLDYDFDFTEWLASKPSAVPTSFQVIAQPGITVVSSNENDGVVKVLLSGGTDGERYKITCRLSTNTGLTRESQCLIVVKDV